MKKIMLKFQIFYLIKIVKHQILRPFSKGISKEQMKTSFSLPGDLYLPLSMNKELTASFFIKLYKLFTKAK